MNSKSTIIIWHLLPCILVAGVALAVGLFKEDPLTGAVFASQVSGYVAVFALLFSLAIGPFHRQAAKHSGLLSAELALIHSLISIWLFLDFRWSDLLYQIWLRAGVAALAILLVIYLVSKLRRSMEPSSWRAFFIFGHVAAALALLHAITAPFSGGLKLVISGICLLAGIIVFKLIHSALTKTKAAKAVSSESKSPTP